MVNRGTTFARSSMPRSKRARRNPESAPRTVSVKGGLLTAAPSRFKSSMERSAATGAVDAAGGTDVPWA
jgi:hypothetical protein